MIEVLSRIQPGQLIGLVAVAGGLLCGLAGIIMGTWHATRRAEIDAALKRDMLDRGMSAHEIRMVLSAGSAACDGDGQADMAPRKPGPNYAREV